MAQKSEVRSQKSEVRMPNQQAAITTQQARDGGFTQKKPGSAPLDRIHLGSSGSSLLNPEF
jgi:hypothetical protein